MFRILPFFLLAVAGRAQHVQYEDLIPNPPLERCSENDDAVKNFVSATLGSNMVLQRDKPAVIWGFDKPGATVTTVLQKGEYDPYPAMTTTVDATSGIWRQTLPAQNATKVPHTIEITSTSGESAKLFNVLFGDVYICSGQSNMQYTLAGTVNATEEAQRGNHYPHIRLFSVGRHCKSDAKALEELESILQPWTVADEQSLLSVGDQYFAFGYFSTVCWVFGREISDALDNAVPLGLISSNWGGTKIDLWVNGGGLFNSMIYPYMVGPMAISGFTWYQGEANVLDQASADDYAVAFPTMIQQWRKGFQDKDAYFGFIQLATSCPKNPEGYPMLRRAQMAALALPNVGYGTNADHGHGCNVHPPDKQYCAKRLAKSALALVYDGCNCETWKSPSYVKATPSVLAHATGEGASHMVTVELTDVSSKGLYVLDEAYNSLGGTFACGPKQRPFVCAWAGVKMAQAGWINATISIQVPDKVVLTVDEDNSGNALSVDDAIEATSYGWGAVPMMTIYDKGTDLPVLGWNEKVAGNEIPFGIMEGRLRG